ncbi:unnamed protein product [Calypogeia fissa]
MTLPKSELSLKVLNLSSNKLKERAVDALASLFESGRLLHLQELDLSRNPGSNSDASLATLTKTMQMGHLPELKKFSWRGNGLGIAGAQAVARAYSENDALTTDIDIDRDEVDYPLVLAIDKYMKRNERLVALRNKLDEEFQVLVPLSSAKSFLCGYPDVGKTRLRKTLKRDIGFWTRFMWETRSKKEPRTRGIELTRIQDTEKFTLIFWDLAGQEEFHVLHGTFLADLGFAGGKATTFVLVFKAEFEVNVQAKLIYWLKFVTSSSDRHVKRQVIIVLNCFDGKTCVESDRRYWMSLIENVAASFTDLLYIHPPPFIIDVRVAASVQPLKDYLFSEARSLLEDVKVPKGCFNLHEDLKVWSEGENEGDIPIFSWQAFEEAWEVKHKIKDVKNLRICASYLHEIGEIMFFDRKESAEPVVGNHSIVVLDPQWFCKKVVGELLLPKHMLEGRKAIQVNADGSISRIRFQALFEHSLPNGTQSDDVISMLEQVGLCYRKTREEIIIPALIPEDDYKLIEWEGKGLDGVIGRCLAAEDTDRSAIPLVLFRRLQVELAQDLSLGGRADSEYSAGRSYSSFKLGEVLVLVQFDVDHKDPSDDRIDILAKSVLNGNSKDVSSSKVNCVCKIMHKLETLCATCCPGLRYDIKVIQPWTAAERTPKMVERQLMSLTEVKALMVEGNTYSGWMLRDHPLELKTFLSETELKEVMRGAEQAYAECKYCAVRLGLLTENSLHKLEVSQQDNCSKLKHLVTRRAVQDDGRLTRQYVEKSHHELLLEIRQKQHVLVGHIQSQLEFSYEERQRSVPRYIFLCRKQGKSNPWISLKEAFDQSFELHFLCEARVDDGFVHEVEGQEGIQLRKPKEWLVKISPWLRRSLCVAIMVGKTVGNVYLPGVFNFIPDLNYLQNDGEGLSKAMDTAAAMMLEEDKELNEVQGDDRNYGTAAAPVDLTERMIAEGVVKDLIRELGEATFRKKIGLRKVLLRATPATDAGSSSQAQSSGAQSSVRWICHSCCKSYGERARAIT